MGCDIHSFAEVRTNGKWEKVTGKVFGSEGDKSTEPFGWRSYAMFGFLADVRNYSRCQPLSQPKGLPDDSEYLNSVSPYAYDLNPMSGQPIPVTERDTVKSWVRDDGNYHSYSYFLLKELLDFDYEQTFWDRRISRTTVTPGGCTVTNGAALAEEGEGEIITYRDHLGEWFFNDIDYLKALGGPEDVRIVFWFDN